ncbi:unnamed protein product [Lactuca saligna]|uniref:At2g35280-like TPR domain-containing protein n=1 Tax=Lactuca saligna TaxID=75948 RepID=A0AA35YN89_LACSI|nr:unnamed protein product [Lactuca saligna]
MDASTSSTMQPRKQRKSLTNMPLEVIEKMIVEKHAVGNKCKEMRNPNIMFRDELMKLFFLEADHEGKSTLEKASTLGHLDSSFILGIMLMAEGRQRKQDALDMLNNAYRKTKVTWNLRATCSKVHLHLNRDWRKHVHFHGFRRTCVMHRSLIGVSDAVVNGYKWVFRYEICLWDACFVRFARQFGIIYE